MKKAVTLEDIVFERLISGESPALLSEQLRNKVDPGEVERLITEAQDRLARERDGDEFEFAKLTSNICKRRLVGTRYAIWKSIAFLIIFLAVANQLVSIAVYGKLGTSFLGILFGGIILVIVEWREDRIVRPQLDRLLLPAGPSKGKAGS